MAILLCISITALAQNQLGTDINGDAAYDGFGWSVSLSSQGNRLAIGAIGNDGNGFDSGQVKVYQSTGLSWNQVGEDIFGEAAYDEMGRSVSLSGDGNRLAIGASGNDGNGINAGHVRTYQWSGSAWTQLGADIDGEAFGDLSGWSVSLSSEGNRLAIGAPLNINDSGINAGHVRVYEWTGSTWIQLGADIDGEAAYDESGRSVSLSARGNHLAIGAARNDGSGFDSGHVRVYRWTGSTWTQLGSDIDGEAFGDFSGSSVSLSASGQLVAIGAVGNDGNGLEAGHVRVYQWSGSAWVQLGTDIEGAAAYDEFGQSAALSADGRRLAAGTGANDGNGFDSGHVRIYEWIGSGWTRLGVDIEGKAAYDELGRSLSLSADASLLATGATGNDDAGFGSGHVRIFDLGALNSFKLNAGLNDAWYFPETDGQGFFITVFPDTGLVSLAWFTYDTAPPPFDAVANLGDPGHRWLTALGPFTGNQATMNIEMTSGGIFDTATEITRTDPPGADGTIVLTFSGCNSGSIEYDIPSINRHGIVPIQRVANDNIALCEALDAD